LKKTIKYIILLSINFVAVQLNSQDFVEIKQETIRDTRIESAWLCNVINNKDTSHKIYIHCKISRVGGDVIYEAESDDFVVEAKKNKNIQWGLITEKRLIKDKIGKNRKIAAGSYRYELELINLESKEALSSAQMMISFDEAGSVYEGQMPIQNKANRLIAFGGDARFTYEYNPMVSNFTQLPNNQYMRLEASPSLILKGVPFTSNILLSNEKFTNTNLNQIDFQFDYYRFKDQLQQLIMEKIKVMESKGDLNKIKDIGKDYIREKYPEMDKLKEKLNSDKFKDIEKQIKSYENVESVINAIEENPDYQKYKKKAEHYAIEKLDTLQKMRDKIPSTDYQQMEWYLTTKKTYDDLKAKEKEYEKYKKTYKEYIKIKEKVSAIENVDYQEILNDPLSMERYLGRMGGISKTLKWVNSIKQLGMGSSYPYYSDLTLSGMRNNGVHIEMNKRNYYAAFTRGTIDAMNYFGYPVGGMNRQLQGGRIGLGKIEDSHVFFNYLKIQDNVKGIDTLSNRPQENMVVGAELQLNLLKKRVMIKSEIAKSFHTLDRMIVDTSNTRDIGESLLSEVPYFRTNSTTHKDIAYNVELNSQFNKDKTTITGYYKYVGGGYVSLGVPYLLRDVKRYEGRLTHYIKERKFSLAFFIRNDFDNLLQNRIYTSYNTSIGGEIGLNFKKLPKVKLAFAPTIQNSISQTQTDSTPQYQARTNMLSLTLVHQYRIGGWLNCVSQITGTGFIGKSTLQDYQTGNISIQQNIQLKKNTGINVFYMQYNQQFDTQQLRITEDGVNMGLEGYTNVSKKINSTFGYNYSKSKTYPERQNWFLEAQVKIVSLAALRLRMNYAKQEKMDIKQPLYNTLNNGFGVRAIMTMHL
jgi:hypothetical protein